MKLFIKFDPKGDFQSMIDRAPGRVRKALVRGLQRGSEIIAKAYVLNLTKNKSIVSGALRSAAAGGFVVDKERLTATIGPMMNPRVGQKVSYGIFVEEGRRPGGWPPRGSLREFARRRLGVPGGRDADRADFLLRRAIARRGTKPRRALEPAFRGSRRAVEIAFNREMVREMNKLSEGGN